MPATHPPNLPECLYFGPLLSTGSPQTIRLVRNDWFASGADWDADGLSRAVEDSIGTCDRPNTTTPLGFVCNNAGSRTNHPCTFYSAGDPSTHAACRRVLQDTDNDGLIDRLELFGYNQFGMIFPRYGANPAHMDMFIELDTYDQVPGTTACDAMQTSTPGAPGYVPELGILDPTTTSGADFITAVREPYLDAPAWMNPDNATGINLHFDWKRSSRSAAKRSRIARSSADQDERARRRVSEAGAAFTS